MKGLESCVEDSAQEQQAGRSSTAAHTPLPWAVQRFWKLNVVPASDREKGCGGSIYADEDFRDFAREIATAGHNRYSQHPHEFSKSEAEANAAFIVRACNNHYKLMEVAKAFADLALEGRSASGEFFDELHRIYGLARRALASVANEERGVSDSTPQKEQRGSPNQSGAA